MNIYLQETKEFQEVLVTLDGTPILSGFEVALVPRGTRPTVWSAPVELSGKKGVMIEGLTTGTYTIYVKVTDTPEIPVIAAGSVVVQ